MIMKKISLLFTSVMFLYGTASVAQKSVTEFLNMGKGAAEVMSRSYLQPYGEMLGKSLNGGWYNSASIHKTGGFDIAIGVNMTIAPASSESFDVSSLLPQLPGSWSLKDENISSSPTIAGKQAIRPVLVNNDTDAEIEMPYGTGFNMLPMPLVQLSVGLPAHLEVSARFVPNTSLGDAGKVNLYGFGLTHSFKEYLPLLKRFPIWHASIMAGYTRLGADLGVDSYSGGSDQSLDITADGFTSRLLVGIKVPVLDVYTGIGYGSSSSDFALKGDYGSLGKDPIAIGYTNNGFDFNAGLRLKFGFFAIYGDYTFGDYSMLSAGIGFGFR